MANQTTGGSGGSGGIAFNFGDSGGSGGSGGSGFGTIFNAGTAYLVNTTVALNSTLGGGGGSGGAGKQSRYPNMPGGSGGAGGAGGSAFGVIYDTSGLLRMTNCTVASNDGFAGPGGSGGAGGSGGPPGSTGAHGSSGTAVGGVKMVSGVCLNTLLAGNMPSNCSGTITDAGHNLSSDGSCNFTGVGSLNNTNPLLGALADNDGPTLTMALLPGSPAIDAGNNASAPPTDQRGVLRPVGANCDIGAYEFSPPSITSSPITQTAEAGSMAEFSVEAGTFPPPSYQWLLDGKVLAGATNHCLSVSDLDTGLAGVYTVVISNVDGAVTSTPAMLQVIPGVERRSVPAIEVARAIGSLLSLDYASTLSPAPDWSVLDGVSLASTSQFYFDVTQPLPPQRFYRTRLMGKPVVAPLLDLHMVPAITLTGNLGDSLRLDYINQFGPTDAWVTLATITLTNTSQLYFDVSSISQPPRLWRIVPVP